MKEIIQQLENIIAEYTPQLEKLSEADLSFKPSPAKWSGKEYLGHLVDSAQNNIRRFILAQYEERPHIVYAQDIWVAAANYQNYLSADLTSLWSLINKHMIMILKNMPAGGEEREVFKDGSHTVKWLAEDYSKHLLHHLHQVLKLEPLPYP